MKNVTRTPKKKPKIASLAVAPTSTIPKVWYFPTEDPNYVKRCDYNPEEKQYNQNCVTLPLADAPGHLAAAIHWSSALEGSSDDTH